MLFRLSNALASFHDYINKIFANKLYIIVLVYIDNILIYINKADHVNSVWWIFKQLKKYLLYFNLKKCRFY